MRLTAALARLLPFAALGTLGLGVALTLAVAGDTLGYDFLAYHAAAVRVLDGRPAYDMSFEAAGGFGLFYYPPTFVPLVLAFGLLPAGVATWAWIALLLGAFALGVAALPVSRAIRWWIVLLAGLSWPFLYAVKLGQVGPLLFLAVVAGWRWMDRGPVLGASGALGAAIKIQPGLILAWALLTRRWSAVGWGAAVLAGLALVATLVAGPGAWSDFLGLIMRVSDPITTPHNFTPGAVAHQMGMPAEAAAIVQVASSVLVILLVVLAALRLGAVPSYLVAVIASQLLSPVLWDHYALLLLVPVAWLLDRHHWWAAAIILATPLALVAIMPDWVYPLAFWACLIAVIGVGWRARTPHVAPGLAG